MITSTNSRRDVALHASGRFPLHYSVPGHATAGGIMINIAAGPQSVTRSGPQHSALMLDGLPDLFAPTILKGTGGGRSPGYLPRRAGSEPPTTSAFAAAKIGGKRAITAASPSREDLLATAAKLKFFIITLEQKGGVGKSLCTTVGYETVRIMTGADNVRLIDADVVNRNLSRSGLTSGVDALNAARIDFEGFLFEAAEQLIAGEVAGVVVDSAAGGEAHFRPHLAELARMLRASDSNARLVIARPLTTSPLVIDNIGEFGAVSMTPDMGVLLVRNMGQGRCKEDFAEFDASPEYRAMRELGMTECILESAGAKYSDMITGFGCSFADIARNEPNELGLRGRQLEIARRVFTRPVRLFLARWLYRQTTAFQAGLIESVLRTLP